MGQESLELIVNGYITKDQALITLLRRLCSRQHATEMIRKRLLTKTRIENQLAVDTPTTGCNCRGCLNVRDARRARKDGFEKVYKGVSVRLLLVVQDLPYTPPSGSAKPRRKK